MTKTKLILNVIKEAQARGAATEMKLRVLPKVELSEAEKWLAKGERWDRQARWGEAANIYWSLFTKVTEPVAKVRYGERVVQMYVNVGDYGRANKLLSELEKRGEEIKVEKEKQRALARVNLRRAWLADVQGRPGDEMKLLTKAKRLTEDIPRSQRDDEDRKRLSTIKHFCGRASYELAMRAEVAKKRASYLARARKYFEADLEEYRQMEPSAHKTSGMAYNLAWLARVAMKEENLKEAERRVDEASEYFREVAKVTKSRIAWHQIHSLKAEMAICRNDSGTAGREAMEALRMLIPDGSYYDGCLSQVRWVVMAAGLGEKEN